MTESQRTPYDGKPYYCIFCGLGLGEYYACEDVRCRLETEEAAIERRDRKLAETSPPPPAVIKPPSNMQLSDEQCEELFRKCSQSLDPKDITIIKLLTDRITMNDEIHRLWKECNHNGG